MKSVNVSQGNLEEVMFELEKEITKYNVIVLDSNPLSTGKWTMTRLWRSWMSTIAEFMTNNGATMPLMIKKDGSHYGKRPFNKNDAHDLFVSQYLGVDNNGLRLSFAKTSHDGMRAATKGERFNAMLKVEIWAIEKGIKLMQPRTGEFFQEKEKGNY
jgi:hypothetical protein